MDNNTRKYWFTIQYPNDQSCPLNTAHEHENVYAQTGRHTILSQIQLGDIVFIYETKTGEREVGTLPLYTGYQGIVTIAEVINTVVPTPTPLKHYTSGKSINWGYYVEADPVCHYGRVSQADTNKILGYKPHYNFHGFGIDYSGVKEISRNQAQQLKTIFCKNRIQNTSCPSCLLVI